MEIKNCKHCGFPPIEVRCTEIHGALGGKNYEIERKPFFACFRKECQEDRIKKALDEQRDTAISEWNSENNTEF